MPGESRPDPIAVLAALSMKSGLLAERTEWSQVGEWDSFSAEFFLFESGPERIALKMGTNWSGEDVAFLVGEINRVGGILASLSHDQLVMPQVLGYSENPPALALEYLPGEALFDQLPQLEENERTSVLYRCGKAVGAFHRSQPSQGFPSRDMQAVGELQAALRRCALASNTPDAVRERLQIARSFRFSPNDILLGSAGDIVLLDPPHVTKYDFVQRDLGSFVMEMCRSLIGERPPRGSAELELLESGLSAFLGGYGETSGSVIGGEERWAMWAFAASRVVGVGLTRLKQRKLGSAARAAAWARWLRSEARQSLG